DASALSAARPWATAGTVGSITSFISNRQINLPRVHLDLVGLGRLDRREAERATCLQLETRAMPRALDLRIVQLAVREREIPVRAVVLYRVDLALDVGEADLHAIHLYGEELPRRDLLQGSDPYVLSHRDYPILSAIAARSSSTTS